MRDFDSFFENGFRFEYYRSGISTHYGHYREKKHVVPVSVLAQLFKGHSVAVINGKTYRKDPGTVTLLPPGSVTESDVTGDTLVFRWVKFNFLFDIGINLFSLYSFPTVFDAGTSLRLGRKIAQLAKCRSSNAIETIVKRKRIGWGLCEDMMPFAEKRPEFDRILSGASRLSKVFALIAERGPRAISVATLAKAANLSISRFHALFRETTGLSPHAYIAREKLKRAQELLRTTDKTLDEISLETGFYDPYHFGRQFKKMFGMPPGQYRHMDPFI